jgi:6-phosphogluconolactonase
LTALFISTISETSSGYPEVDASSSWPSLCAWMIQQAIESALAKNGSCSVLLTGGRAASVIYREWSRFSRFKALRNADFFFGDERCVAPDHPQSNYRMVMQTLFASGIPQGCRVHRIEAERSDAIAAADHYASLLPERADILLLSVGEDGHIASLFPQSPVLHESDRRVVPVIGNKSPRRRITITPPVIARAERTFVLALGEAKARILHEAQLSPKDIDTLPARLVLGATWLLDGSS